MKNELKHQRKLIEGLNKPKEVVRYYEEMMRSHRRPMIHLNQAIPSTYHLPRKANHQSVEKKRKRKPKEQTYIQQLNVKCVTSISACIRQHSVYTPFTDLTTTQSEQNSYSQSQLGQGYHLDQHKKSVYTVTQSQLTLILTCLTSTMFQLGIYVLFSILTCQELMYIISFEIQFLTYLLFLD